MTAKVVLLPSESSGAAEVKFDGYRALIIKDGLIGFRSDRGTTTI
jgi:hypothetical protein